MDLPRVAASSSLINPITSLRWRSKRWINCALLQVPGKRICSPFKQASCLLLTRKSLASNPAGEEGRPVTSIILSGRVESLPLPRFAEHLRSPHTAPKTQILT